MYEPIKDIYQMDREYFSKIKRAEDFFKSIGVEDVTQKATLEQLSNLSGVFGRLSVGNPSILNDIFKILFSDILRHNLIVPYDDVWPCAILRYTFACRRSIFLWGFYRNCVKDYLTMKYNRETAERFLVGLT